MRTIVLSVIAVLMMGVAAQAADEMVDNPTYQHWAKFKPGAFVKLQQTMTQGGQKMQMTVTQTLKELTPERAMVEMAGSMDMGGVQQQMPARTMPIPAKVPKARVPATQPLEGKTQVSQGDEELTVAGKKVKCHWFEGKMSSPEGGAFSGKTWVNPGVPGNMVKMQGKGEGRGPGGEKGSVEMDMVVIDFSTGG